MDTGPEHLMPSGVICSMQALHAGSFLLRVGGRTRAQVAGISIYPAVLVHFYERHFTSFIMCRWSPTGVPAPMWKAWRSRST